MRFAWGLIASIGLFLCALGFLQLPPLVHFFVTPATGEYGPTIIGVGACIFAFARTWLLITWRIGEHPHRGAAGD